MPATPSFDSTPEPSGAASSARPSGARESTGVEGTGTSSHPETAIDTDAALMAQVAAGDETACATLYDTYGTRILGFLHRCCGDRALAEDLLQDVFVKAFAAADRWQPVAPVRAWLFQIAKRHWWTRHAWRRRRKGLVRGLGGVGPSLEPEGGWSEGAWSGARAPVVPSRETRLDRLDRPALQAALRQAVASLPARLRVVFVLVRLEGCKLAEAAMIADVPVGTVKSRLVAAERKLRTRLRPFL